MLPAADPALPGQAGQPDAGRGAGRGTATGTGRGTGQPVSPRRPRAGTRPRTAARPVDVPRGLLLGQRAVLVDQGDVELAARRPAAAAAAGGRRPRSAPRPGMGAAEAPQGGGCERGQRGRKAAEPQPAPSRRPAISASCCSAESSRATTARPCPARVSPASVSPTGRVPRSSRVPPTARSSAATCWLTADWCEPEFRGRGWRRNPPSATASQHPDPPVRAAISSHYWTPSGSYLPLMPASLASVLGGIFWKGTDMTTTESSGRLPD